METNNIRPSLLQRNNLIKLYSARTSYFTHKGLYPYLISTRFFYVDEGIRVPLAKALLPLIADDNNRRLLEKAINGQGEKWESINIFESSWTLFRKMGIGSLVNQQFEDLLQLDYFRLFDGVTVPDSSNLSLFWGGLVDFLVNSWSILEEYCIVIDVKNRIQEQNKIRERESSQRDDNSVHRAVPLVYWADMQLEHHLMNLVLRLRAGWDKLADYVVAPYYGVTPAKRWEARLDKLNREIRSRLNDEQRMFWDNCLANARKISVEGGLKDVRDFELHKIALRAKETLGNPERAFALQELENFVLSEHFRIQESFLLVLAMIRST